MAEMATYIGVTPRTVIGGAAIARGVRVTRQPDGTVAVQDATARGDYVSLIASAAAAEPFAAASIQDGGKVPALASEATNVGDLAYSAAAGKFSKTAAGAVLCGRWVVPASGDGVLGEVELLNPA